MNGRNVSHTLSNDDADAPLQLQQRLDVSDNRPCDIIATVALILLSVHHKANNISCCVVYRICRAGACYADGRGWPLWPLHCSDWSTVKKCLQFGKNADVHTSAEAKMSPTFLYRPGHKCRWHLSASVNRHVYGSLWRWKHWSVRQIKPAQLAFGRTLI